MISRFDNQFEREAALVHQSLLLSAHGSDCGSAGVSALVRCPKAREKPRSHPILWEEIDVLDAEIDRRYNEKPAF